MAPPEKDHSVPTRRHTVWWAILAVALALAILGLAVVRPWEPADPPGADPATGRTTGATPENDGPSDGEDPAPDDPRLEVALSTPREDSVYPKVGDPGVDALHYSLALTWNRDERRLEGTERLVFRAAATAERFQLDLAGDLEVGELAVDGRAAAYRHTGKDLVIETPVTLDQRVVVELTYAGTPEPADAPVTRSDFSTIGWHTNKDGTSWTMQEPFGAYTWYAVNDQPSDKALYDFTLVSDSHLVGVANGELRDTRVTGDTTTQRWHLADPASSYLVTVAFDDFVRTDGRTASGVPITWWIPSDQQTMLKYFQKIVPLAAWAEARLGPYPWPTLGLMMVDSDSAMETQSMITFGDSDYIRSEHVILHEFVHQWFGDLVTPRDWRDVWINEGVTTYIQALHEAEQSKRGIGPTMRSWRKADPTLRGMEGPPGDYDPQAFGSGNVYFSAALMWHEIHQLLGDDAFWELLRAWTQEHARDNATRDDLFALIKERAAVAPEGGWDAFFDAWIMGSTSPVAR